VAERDRAAIDIDMRRVVREMQLAQHGQRLAGEGFVEFDGVDL